MIAEPVEVGDSSSAPLTDSCMLYMCVYVSDINECVENRDNCEQLCNNRAGDFTCSCRSGYQLDSDGHSCTGKYCVGLWELSCSCAPLLRDLLLQILMSVSQGPLVVSRSVTTQMAASSAAVGVDTPLTQIAGHAQVA